MNEIAERFRTYKVKVIPKDAPPVQYIECRRAYYAGAQALADLWLRLESDLVSPTQRKKELHALVEEITLFQGDVSAGRA